MNLSDNCFNEKRDNYETEIMRNDFFENRNYLKKMECCNSKSCNDLAFEYQKLVNKCHDSFSRVGSLRVNERRTITM